MTHKDTNMSMQLFEIKPATVTKKYPTYILDGKCLAEGVVYQARVKREDVKT